MQIDVVQAAIDYIDELHLALARRFNLFSGESIMHSLLKLKHYLQYVNTPILGYLSNNNALLLCTWAVHSAAWLYWYFKGDKIVYRSRSRPRSDEQQ